MLCCSAKAYPLNALLQDCHKFLEVTGRRVTFEYTLLAGVNDSPAQASTALASQRPQNGVSAVNQKADLQATHI